MSAVSTKSTRRAIVREVTEGVPVSPTGSANFLALQEGFDHGFSFETLENAELKGSIGQSKSILGLETSTPTMSHYLRHSGTEATAPGYSLLLESLFGRTQIRATERDTVVGSTTLVVNVAGGEGVEFLKGDLVLVKDAVNGFAIRPVESVATDALTLGFALSTAPAAAVNLGRSIMYRPADDLHPTMTVWDYIGNGGIIKMSSGNRVVSGSFSFEAGQLINADYSMEGIKVYWNPVVITAANQAMDFNDGTQRNALVPIGVYKDTIDFVNALSSSMNALTADAITVSYSSITGRYTLTSDGATFGLLFDTGTNAAETIAAVLGFPAADQTAALTYTSATPIALGSPFSPAFDSSDPLSAKANLMMLGGPTDNLCVAASSVTVSVTNTKANINSICSESGVASSLITERAVTVSMTLQLNQYESARFHRFHENETTRFMYIFGTKSGGNWVAGKCGAIYIPTAVISSLETADQDSYQIVNIELTGFVNDLGQGEVFLGFV